MNLKDTTIIITGATRVGQAGDRWGDRQSSYILTGIGLCHRCEFTSRRGDNFRV